MNFKEAAQQVTQLSQRPNNATLLKLYGLYKQGSEGDITGKRPGLMDFKGRAKYDAWKELAGMDPQTAQEHYIKLVADLVRNDS